MKPSKKTAFILGLLLIINAATSYSQTSPARQQSTVITGKVSDVSNSPLNSVSISIKEHTGGTSTDNSGNFTLSVPDKNATLVFSFVGYTTEEVPLNGKSTINVTLQSTASSMGEVVVVGYGTQKKSVVTGAISSVKAADLENQQIGRLEQALQGRASGLTIASSSGAPG